MKDPPECNLSEDGLNPAQRELKPNCEEQKDNTYLGDELNRMGIFYKAKRMRPYHRSRKEQSCDRG